MAVSQRSGDVAVFGGGDFIKSLDVNQVYEGFWRKPAYLVPDSDCACIDSGTTPTATRPIGRFSVRSFITSVPDGARSSAHSVGLHHHFIDRLRIKIWDEGSLVVTAMEVLQEVRLT